MRRASSKVFVLAASTMIAVCAWTPAVRMAPASRAAAGPAGWQIEHVFGSCYGVMNSVTATSTTDAWAAGEWYGCGSAPTHEHQLARWNGSTWQELPHAPGFASSSVGTAVAALSSSYSWTFVDRKFDPQPTMQSFALLWHSGRWRAFRLADGSTMTSAVAFSPSDAWAFGSIPNGQSASAYAVRFNGEQWRRVQVPVVPDATTAPGPANIWAVGPVPNAAAYAVPRRWALAHWTGRWHTTPLPHLNLSRGRHIEGIWVVTDGSGGAWVAITMSTSGLQPYADGGDLLHWTGRRWLTVVPKSYYVAGLGPLAHDGHGGLWIWLTPIDGTPTPLGMLHLSATGTWSEDPISTTANGIDVLAMRLIPGTDSVWAAGVEDLPGQLGVMLKYNP